MSAPPVDINRNAHPAKVSGFEKQTRITSCQYKLLPLVCKRRFLPTATNQLLQFASNQNCLERHFGMSQSAARQIRESRFSLSETLRRDSYLLSTAQPQSAGTSGSALPSCAVPRSSKKKINFGATDTPHLTPPLRGQQTPEAPPPLPGGSVWTPSLDERGGR